MADARLAGQVLGGADTGDGPGVDGLQRIGGVHLRHATGVMDDQHGLVVAGVAQVVRKLAQRVEHDLVKKAVHDSGRGAHVLTLATGHLVSQQDGDRAELMRRVLLQDDFQDPQLMLGVLRGVGQRDHQRLSAVVDELTDHLAHVVVLERDDDLAGGVDALLDRADQLAGTNGSGRSAAGRFCCMEESKPSPYPRPRDRGMVSSKPWVTIAATFGPLRSMSALVPSVVA